VGSRGKTPVGGHKLKKNLKSVYNFNVFLYEILDLMNIRADLGECILQTHNKKMKIQGGVEPPPL